MSLQEVSMFPLYQVQDYVYSLESPLNYELFVLHCFIIQIQIFTGVLLRSYDIPVSSTEPSYILEEFTFTL